MLTEALQLYRMNNEISTTTGGLALIPYLNYVSYHTSGQIDDVQTQGTHTCTVDPCLRLHNGAMLWVSGSYWGGNTSTDAAVFMLDPDGKVTDGTTNGPGKSLVFFLYANGRIATFKTVTSGTRIGTGTGNPWPEADPPWFSWD